MSILKPDTSKMVKIKTMSGAASYHSTDSVGRALAGIPVEVVDNIAKSMGVGDTDKYLSLNPGQRKMALSNRIRTVVKSMGTDGKLTGYDFLTDVVLQHWNEQVAGKWQQAMAEKHAIPAKNRASDTLAEAA
jgi:hypothetical protein